MTFRLISCDGNRVEDEDEAGRAPYISLRAGRRGAAAEVTLRSAGSVMSRRATPPHTHTIYLFTAPSRGGHKGLLERPGKQSCRRPWPGCRSPPTVLRKPVETTHCRSRDEGDEGGVVSCGGAGEATAVPGSPRGCRGVCGVPGESDDRRGMSYTRRGAQVSGVGVTVF